MSYGEDTPHTSSSPDLSHSYSSSSSSSPSSVDDKTQMHLNGTFTSASSQPVLVDLTPLPGDEDKQIFYPLDPSLIDGTTTTSTTGTTGPIAHSALPPSSDADADTDKPLPSPPVPA
ncbi:hypothetical protein IAU59_001225 [Kwoniella sp. CBS 9459]